MGKVVLRVEGWGQPVAEPSDYLGRLEDKAVKGYWSPRRGNLWLGGLQCMSSVLGVENLTSSWLALAVRVRKRAWRRRMLVRCESEATVREKSST